MQLYLYPFVCVSQPFISILKIARFSSPVLEHFSYSLDVVKYSEPFRAKRNFKEKIEEISILQRIWTKKLKL